MIRRSSFCFKMSSEEDDTFFVTQNTFTDHGAGFYQPCVSDISDCENERDKVKAQYGYSDESKIERAFPVAGMVAKEVQSDYSSGNPRFGKPVDEETLINLQRRQFADSTVMKIKSAVKTFKEWQAERNKTAPRVNNSPILKDLENMTKDELNYCISRFICETKRTDGTDYPPDTLYSFVICLQLYMDTLEKKYRFLVDDSFAQIRNTLDNAMKKNSKSCPAKRQADVITVEEEELLWSRNVLGSDTPKQLLFTLVYLLAVNFALRGGQEHRDLRRGQTSQLKIRENIHGGFLQYTEEVSNTNNGGLKYRKIQPKSVVAYEHKYPDRCVVKLFEKYCSHIPSDAGTYDLYLRPLENSTSNIWYSKQPLGRHRLASVVREICTEGGLTGYRTNHSLRASAASRLYQAEVDEQIICEVTGHRSVAVRNYKRTTEEQRKEISSVIQGTDKAQESTTNTLTCKTKDDRNVTINLNINVT